jgi:hypothetical protein
VGAFDFEYTKTLPPPREIDANPYGVLASDSSIKVADAGSNTLDRVSLDGDIDVLQHFQRFNPATFPTDAVPTCVAPAEHGLFVADLSGRLFLFHDGTATQLPAAHLTHVTGCVTGKDGALYLVNMWAAPQPSFPSPFSGSVVKYNPENGSSTVLVSGMNFPNMPAIGPDGNLYVSVGSICPAGGIPVLCPNGGTIVRITLPHDD